MAGVEAAGGAGLRDGVTAALFTVAASLGGALRQLFPCDLEPGRRRPGWTRPRATTPTPPSGGGGGPAPAHPGGAGPGSNPEPQKNRAVAKWCNSPVLMGRQSRPEMYQPDFAVHLQLHQLGGMSAAVSSRSGCRKGKGGGGVPGHGAMSLHLQAQERGKSLLA